MKIKNRYSIKTKCTHTILLIFIVIVFSFESMLYLSLSLDIFSLAFIFHAILNTVFIYNIVTVLNPRIIVKDTFIVIYSIKSMFRKKIAIESIKNISAVKNTIIHDNKYDMDAIVIDVFLISGKMIRCAMDENDYKLFVNSKSIRGLGNIGTNQGTV